MLQVITRTVQLARYFYGFNSPLLSGIKTQGDFGGLFKGKNASYETVSTAVLMA
jgi:hypothetical protein